MKRYFKVYLLMFLLVLVGCQQQTHEHTEAEGTYTCPMHPEVVQNTPGSCPICGMDLVPQAATHGEKTPVTDELAALLQPTNQTIIAAVATVTPERRSIKATVQLDGVITYDEREINTISARVAGRIERLYVTYNFQPIRKGQKLLEIYSPELLTAQQELLYIAQQANPDQMLVESAKQKLHFLGATTGQIKQLIRSGKPVYTFAVYSPYDGYLTGMNTSLPVAAPTTASPAAGMGSTSMAAATPASPSLTAGQAIELREGNYVSPGQSLLRVVNPNKVWAEFNVATAQEVKLAPGDSLRITFPQLPDKELQTRIDFVQPYYTAGENFAKIRTYLPGMQKQLRVGQLVTGVSSYVTAPSLWVPRDATRTIGTVTVVFLKEGNAFRPQVVSTGITENRKIQILDGLNASDVVAANAQFLVDSESFISTRK